MNHVVKLQESWRVTLLSLLFLSLAMPGFAQGPSETIILKNVDGREVYFEPGTHVIVWSYKNKIKGQTARIDGEDLILTSGFSEISIPLISIHKFSRNIQGPPNIIDPAFKTLGWMVGIGGFIGLEVALVQHYSGFGEPSKTFFWSLLATGVGSGSYAIGEFIGGWNRKMKNGWMLMDLEALEVYNETR